ncbi:hypothetical protein [Streptomyces fagopyri]
MLTDPTGDAYASHRVHAPGEVVALPGPTGAEVAPDADEFLKAAQSGAS